MGQSVRASEKGLAIANQARQRRGWTKTSTARWWQDAHTSRATLRRFWQGERIQQAAFIGICQAVGIEDWQAIADASPRQTSAFTEQPLSQEQQPSQKQQPSQRPQVDWGDAPDIEQFYGRTEELAQLQHWAVQERAKLINIYGLGGIGKTALAVALVEQIQADFDGVIWRSVDEQSPLETWIMDLLEMPSEDPEKALQQFRQKLQQERCLMIFDTVSGASVHWEAIAWVSRTRHQSCILVVSREPLVDPQNTMRSLSLSGLSLNANVQLLQACGCHGNSNQVKALARLYGYNPLVLKLVAATIRTVFGGAIAHLLKQDNLLFPDPIRQLLKQQFTTLKPLEKTLMFWLAIWQEPIAFVRLQTHLFNTNSAEVIEALAQLVGRSLINRYFLADEPSFGLQPIVMTFVIMELVQTAVQEMNQAQQQGSIQPFQLLRTHCLVRPGTDDILGDRVLIALQETWQQQGTQPPWASIEKWLIQAQCHEASTTLGYLVFNLSVLKGLHGWDL